MADSYSTNTVEREIWKWNASAQMNLLYERLKGQRYYSYLGASVFNQNAAESGDLNLLTLDQYKGKGGINTDVITAGNSLYVGNFNVFTDGNVYGKFVLIAPFKKLNWFGFSAFFEQRFRKDRQVTNCYLGIPMNFEGKEEQRVNLEMQFIWSNVFNALSAEKNAEANFSIGFKVGIPFETVK